MQKSSIRELCKALLPFARAASDYEPPRSAKHWQEREHIALSLTVGDVRRAREVLMENLNEIEEAVYRWNDGMYKRVDRRS